MLLSMISTFSRIGPNIEPQFREEVVISQLARWSMENNSCGDTNLRKTVALALIDAYCALYCCFISTSITQDSFLPGLKSLQLDLKELGLEGGAVIGSMVSEIQHKLEGASASPSRVSEGTTPATSSPSTEPHLAKSSKSLMNKIMDKSASTKMSSFSLSENESGGRVRPTFIVSQDRKCNYLLFSHVIFVFIANISNGIVLDVKFTCICAVFII
ncbi:KIAA1468 [Bugula neritina]|uniref:KIAA1468 n=1 Tax=Bugula neritina TaxID=10212 RepID=A0A7J7KJ36_BUGNE|nr:KIAA1468 [Bugula neritina]